jgi:predicted nucleotidyltransferase
VNIIDIGVETIKEKFPAVAGVWLFGSIASGTGCADSDIDLAVLLQQKADSVMAMCSTNSPPGG